jgi:hypothetical protein
VPRCPSCAADAGPLDVDDVRAAHDAAKRARRARWSGAQIRVNSYVLRPKVLQVLAVEFDSQISKKFWLRALIAPRRLVQFRSSGTSRGVSDPVIVLNQTVA